MPHPMDAIKEKKNGAAWKIAPMPAITTTIHTQKFKRKSAHCPGIFYGDWVLAVVSSK
jgi:hypothetical protein